MKLKLFAPLVGFACAAVLFIAGCKKDVLDHQSVDHNQSAQRLHSLLANPDDSVDEQMNDYLFMLANGLASFANNSSMMSTIYTKAALNEGDVLYGDLISADSNFKTYMNDFLYDNYYSHEDPSFDCYNAIDSGMIVSGRDYTPGVTVMNIETCNQSLLPYVCIGASADSADAIIAYKINSDGTNTEMLITEGDAADLANPVIIVNNAATSPETTTQAENYNTYTPPSSQADTTWVQLEFRMFQVRNGYRYESGINNYSEVHHLVSFYENDYNTWQQGPGYGQKRYQDMATLGGVSPHQVSVSHQFVGWWYLAPAISTFDKVWDRLYLTIYEYDWYAFKKPVTVCNYQVTHRPRMKYSNEWYVNNICGYKYLYYFPTADSVGAMGQVLDKFSYSFTRTH